jgi:hypothetical protein
MGTFHNGLEQNPSSSFFAFCGEFRLRPLPIGLDMNVALMNDIWSLVLRELRPTSYAVIMVPVFAGSAIFAEPECLSTKTFEIIETPVG